MKKNLLFTVLLSCSSYFAFAQIVPFTTGNIVVSRSGNGISSITSMGFYLPVSLLEFTPNGILKQTIPLDANFGTTANAQEGGLALSSAGQVLTIIGTNASVSQNSATTVASPTTLDKRIATIGADPSTITYLPITSTLYNNVPRNVVRNDADGSFYVAGNSSGVKYIPADGSSAASVMTNGVGATNGSALNTKFVDIKGGKLYASGFNTSVGLSSVGTSLPTNNQTRTALTGINQTTGAGSNGSVLFDLNNDGVLDLIYNLDASGTVRKYYYNTTTSNWDDKGTQNFQVLSSAFVITTGGSGYGATANIDNTGTGGSGAAASVTVTNGKVISIAVTNGGSGYTTPPTITFTDANGTGATATATVSGGVVTQFVVATQGSGYGPTVTVSAPTGAGGATATLGATTIDGVLTGINVINAGFGYMTTAPTVTINGSGTGAAATNTGFANLSFGIAGALTTGGKPMLFLTPGQGSANSLTNSLLRMVDDAAYNATFSATSTNLAQSDNNYLFRGVALSPGTTTLPVNLTSFKGKNTTNGIQLNWETASENNNDRFEVLRSNDANNFQLITSIKGKGTSTVSNKYAYLDTKPLDGTNYYKLNQVDFDGKTTPSSVIAVNTGLSENTVAVYATTQELSLTINALKSGSAKIQVIDLSGRKVLDKVISLNSGLNNNSFSIANLQQGIYIATVQIDNGKSFVQKFTK